MLRYIPPILSPELLKVLAEMGHGDKLVIGDANFAAASMAKNSILIRCDGLKATDLMDAILTLMPLDDFVDKPVLIMDKEPRHAELECPVWDGVFILKYKKEAYNNRFKLEGYEDLELSTQILHDRQI